MKNILFVIDDLASGGAQRQMVKMAIALKKENSRVSVLTYFPRDFYGLELRNAGIETNCLEFSNPFKRILAFRSFIRKGKYDLVISYLGIPNFLCEVAAIPYKRWELIANERSANPAILKSTKSIFIRFFHLFADKVVCNSYANKLLVKKANPFLRPKNIEVIYNMMDLEDWKPLEDFSFKRSGKLNLVIAASHRHLKNFLGLLKALMLLTETERKQITIKWYGNNLTPPFYDSSLIECKSFLRENKLDSIIELHPATVAIKERLQQADVVCLLSFFEGLPNAICEGMALGKPILASSVSDIPLLVEDGLNGVLIDPNDPESIASGLNFFISSESTTLEEMGRIGRVKALQLFDQNLILNSFKGLL
jgi:glycosyltransferase involved in cell wall biosynthesis